MDSKINNLTDSATIIERFTEIYKTHVQETSYIRKIYKRKSNTERKGENVK